MAGNTTNADILQGINQVVKAINDLGITIGSGGSGGSGGGGSGGGCGGCGNFPVTSPSGSILDVEPAPALGNPSSDPPPDGFESWEAYNLYKCKAANFLFDSTLGTMRFFGGLDAAAAGIVAGAVFGTWLLAQIGAFLAAGLGAVASGAFVVTTPLAAAMTGGFLVSAPGWAIAAIVAAIAVVTAAAGVGVLIFFDSLADDFEEKRQDVVCQLFNANNVGEANSILAEAFTDSTASFIISEPYDAFESAIRTLAQFVGSYFFPNSFLNQLFEPSELVENYTGAQAECDECNCAHVYDDDESWEGWTVFLDNGTGTELDIVDGKLEACYGAGSSPGARVESPEINYVIKPGDAFTFNVTVGANTTFFMWLIIDTSEVQVHAGTALTGTHSYGSDNLSEWEGLTVEKIRLYTARGGAQGAFCAEYNFAAIGCPGEFPSE